jgi:hypothetical protein
MQAIEVNSSDYDNITDFESFNEMNDQAHFGANHFKKGKLKKAFKKVGRVALAVSTGGASELATKKGRAGIKKGVKKVGKVLKEIALDTTIFAPLVPLVPMMKKGLQKKGKPVPKGVSNIAKSFYNEVVVKHGSYEQIHYDNDLDADNIIAEAASGIVKGVLEFIKGLKKHKAEGGKLTPTEEAIVAGTDLAAAKIDEQAKDEAAGAVGKRILFDRKTQIIIVAVLVAIIAGVWYFRSRK